MFTENYDFALILRHIEVLTNSFTNWLTKPTSTPLEFIISSLHPLDPLLSESLLLSMPPTSIPKVFLSSSSSTHPWTQKAKILFNESLEVCDSFYNTEYNYIFRYSLELSETPETVFLCCRIEFDGGDFSGGINYQSEKRASGLGRKRRPPSSGPERWAPLDLRSKYIFRKDL